MNSSSRTRPFAEVTFRASETHFVLKITTFRAPAIYSNFTEYCACHAKWLSWLIFVTYETSFTMRGATGITLQPHQILRLPRKSALQNLSKILRERLKRQFQCAADSTMIRPWSEHDPSMNSSSRTRPFAEVTFRASETHFVLKITTFRAPAIYSNFTEYCACHEKWHSDITKYCACHEKWHSDITKCCACHERWHSDITKYCACHEKWDCYWTVTELRCYWTVTELLLNWTVTGLSLSCYWTDLLLISCYWAVTELLLNWTDTGLSLNCYWTDLLLSCYWTALLLNCYWTVTELNCYWTVTQLLLNWPVTHKLLLSCYWTVTELNCYRTVTQLFLNWPVTQLLLDCYWTDLLLNCYWTDLLLNWAVTQLLLNCYWTVTLHCYLNCYCTGLFAFLNLRNSEVSQLNFLWLCYIMLLLRQISGSLTKLLTISLWTTSFGKWMLAQSHTDSHVFGTICLRGQLAQQNCRFHWLHKSFESSRFQKHLASLRLRRECSAASAEFLPARWTRNKVTLHTEPWPLTMQDANMWLYVDELVV